MRSSISFVLFNLMLFHSAFAQKSQHNPARTINEVEVRRDDFSLICVRALGSDNVCNNLMNKQYFDIVYGTGQDIKGAWNYVRTHCSNIEECKFLSCYPVSFIWQPAEKKHEVSCECSYQLSGGQCGSIGRLTFISKMKYHRIDSIQYLNFLCKMKLEEQSIPDSAKLFIHSCEHRPYF